MIKNCQDDLLVYTYNVVLLNEDDEYMVSFDSVEKSISIFHAIVGSLK
jgi:hypothetical protein